MSAARYLPRDLSIDGLIRTLVEEHDKMRELLRLAKEATDKGDFEAVSRDLKLLDPIFKQHIADEEAQVLRLLIGELGRKGAEEEIRIFQQHRPIYRLMQAVSELASKEAMDLGSEQTKLNALFDDHANAEELLVFPKALACLAKRTRA
ncbi:MAG TPA: hemerythrin domain-containing protein [Nitrososphaerales archaeon]|nr:hemerythrin domain-containing protein [Nitrososphaerales archaeon]